MPTNQTTDSLPDISTITLPSSTIAVPPDTIAAPPNTIRPRQRPKMNSWQILAWQWEAVFLPPFPATKEIRQHPAFMGSISRAFWLLITHRLTVSGLWFLGLTLLVFSAASPTLELQIYIPMLYVLAVWVVAQFASYAARPKVSLAARFPGRVRVGTVVRADVIVKQQGRRPLSGGDQVLFLDRLPPFIDAGEESGVPLPSLRKGESAHVTLTFTCNKRGVYPLKRLRVASDFPFGIINTNTYHKQEHTILVYPRFVPLLKVQIPLGTGEGGRDISRLARRGESFDLLGNREYRPGDNIRNMDWRATARLQTPILREWREEQTPRVALLLDTFVVEQEPVDWRRRGTTPFERAVSLCAALGDALGRQGSELDTIFLSGEPHALAARNRDEQMYLLLDALARVPNEREDGLFVHRTRILSALERQGGVLMVLLDWDAVRQELCEMLTRMGVGQRVLLVRDDAPTLPLPTFVTRLTRADFDRGIGEL